MKRLFLSKQAKIAVDILLVASFIVTMVNAHSVTLSVFWTSAHCIAGIVWLSLIIIHVAQHARMIQSFKKKSVIQKNKITALISISFILIFISAFLLRMNVPILTFHKVSGVFFVVMTIIHIIDKRKQFAALFKK